MDLANVIAEITSMLELLADSTPEKFENDLLGSAFSKDLHWKIDEVGVDATPMTQTFTCMRP